MCFPGRTANLDITVGEDGATYDLCKQVGSEGRNAATFAKCQRPLRGRYVRLKRHMGVFEDYIINLCEIQVYGYLYYGNTRRYQDLHPQYTDGLSRYGDFQYEYKTVS